MKSLPPIAQGDTFSFDVELLDPDDNPVNIVEAKCQIQDEKGCAIADLTWNPHPSNVGEGTFSLTSEETAELPVTGVDTQYPLVVIAQFTDNDGNSESLEPLLLTVNKGVQDA